MADFGRPLTAMAEQLRDRNQAFQNRMTAAASRIISDPQGALSELQSCEREVQALEQDEQHLLEQLHALEPQRAQCRQMWIDVRFQLFFGQGNAYLLLGQFAEARNAVAAARRVESSDPGNPGKAMLANLEKQISVAEN